MSVTPKPTAVISSNLASTVRWIKHKYKVRTIDLKNKEVILEDGTRLVIVLGMEDALSWEFSNYIVDPDYWPPYSIIDAVKERIR